MTNLERSALLGDRKAQEECTEKGIVLPCMRCGNKWTQVRYMGWGRPSAFQTGYRGECVRCHIITAAYQTKKEALADWNTRSALPIGRCRDCATKEKATVNAKGFLVCPASGMEITDADFCSYFEPKEG